MSSIGQYRSFGARQWMGNVGRWDSSNLNVNSWRSPVRGSSSCSWNVWILVPGWIEGEDSWSVTPRSVTLSLLHGMIYQGIFFCLMGS